MRISDWSSDVCSSDLLARRVERGGHSRITHHTLRYKDDIIIISDMLAVKRNRRDGGSARETGSRQPRHVDAEGEEAAGVRLVGALFVGQGDRKSTRLNSSH